ncbi:hypothetical protein F2Q68_00031080 [Brassica cretica]|uniref:Uncharacterized protein n=1 Tax=Brassica cretica TaxID=69181 RepID=A0A8S9G4I4_BRACR|nr:hypothetical protein F2Q68_00031080 [Brassica cretica]
MVVGNFWSESKISSEFPRKIPREYRELKIPRTFRRNISWTVRRYLLGYFRWNGPRKHSGRKEVSEYSDEPRPSEYSEKPLPSEYSEEVYPSGYSVEICPWNIPRKLSSEYPEGYTSSEYSQK